MSIRFRYPSIGHGIRNSVSRAVLWSGRMTSGSIFAPGIGECSSVYLDVEVGTRIRSVECCVDADMVSGGTIVTSSIEGQIRMMSVHLGRSGDTLSYVDTYSAQCVDLYAENGATTIPYKGLAIVGVRRGVPSRL